MDDRAVIFDVMGTLFDLTPLGKRLTEVGAPEGALEAWFGRMLHTAATLTLIGEFHPFAEIARTTLPTTLAQLEVDPERADDVLRALGQLNVYPDASQAFDHLEEAGVTAVTLTNGGRQHTKKRWYVIRPGAETHRSGRGALEKEINWLPRSHWEEPEDSRRTRRPKPRLGFARLSPSPSKTGSPDRAERGH